MNIFVLDQNPRTAARYHCDKHVIKMLIETAQLLSNALPPGLAVYRPTHLSHPCTKWVQASQDNFLWLVDLGLALADEYTARYGKVHKSAEIVASCYRHVSLVSFGALALTPFEQCMPDQYKVPNNSVQAYRNYYIGDKKEFATWKTSVPPWWP